MFQVNIISLNTIKTRMLMCLPCKRNQCFHGFSFWPSQMINRLKRQCLNVMVHLTEYFWHLKLLTDHLNLQNDQTWCK